MKTALLLLLCSTLFAASAVAQSGGSINIRAVGTSLVTSWADAGGVLQQADSVAGPWESVPEANSPYQFTPAGGAKFFRVVHGTGGDVLGSLFTVGNLGGVPVQIVVPSLSVYLVNVNTLAQNAPVTTDINGMYILTAQPPGHYQLHWEGPGWISGSSTQAVAVVDDNVYLSPEQVALQAGSTTHAIIGQVGFPDSAPVHRHDAFYGMDFASTISLLNSQKAVIGSAVPNASGQFVLTGVPNQGTGQIVATCETALTQVPIDFSQNSPVTLVLANHRPAITRVFATLNGQEVSRAQPGATVTLTAQAFDPDNDSLHYLWLPSLSQGGFVSSDSTNVQWTLPASAGIHIMYVRVSDGRGGYATARVRLTTATEILFSGQVSDTDGIPVTNATVTISNVVASTDSGGAFSLTLSNAAPPYLLSITKAGFAPASRVLTDETTGGRFTLYRPDLFSAPSSASDISVTNSRGVELFIPSNSLTRLDGQAVVNPIAIGITSVDPCNPLLESPVSFIAHDSGGSNSFFSSLSTAHLRIRDASGNALTFNAGARATLSLPVSSNCRSNFTDLPASAGIWSYDLTSGVWNIYGGAILHQSPITGTAVYTLTAVAATLNNYNAVDPSGPYSTLTLTNDRTVALPFDMHVVGPAFNYFQTVFVMPITLFVPPSVSVSISVLSHREAPGGYFTDPTNALTVVTPDTGKLVILNSTVTTPIAYQNLFVPLKIGTQVPIVSTKVELAEQFLMHNFGVGSAATAASYYSAIDPANQKTTLASWKTMNGFGVDDASAAYFNASDLGFGRQMHYKRVGSDVAFYVSNHDTVDHARTGFSPIATVAMDYALDPAHAGLGRYTKFYVFDASGTRVDRANLDGNGDKYVPNLCAICHGGNHFSTGASSNATTGFNFNAKFIPFDMDSYTYSTVAAYKPSALHNAFRTMNLGIRDWTIPTSAIQALITGWYGVAGTGTFNRDFVPAAWAGGSDLPVYRDAVKVSCRACHTTRSLDFASPASVGSCGYNVCNSLVMPDAQRTFSILWGSKSANVGLTGTPPNQPAILSTRYGVGSWIAPCP